jgi:hypothetical protein
MDYEMRMHEAKVAAEKKIRDDFQARYPHYTPPPDAGPLEWGAWVGSNLKLHNAEGFRARFPRHAEAIDNVGIARVGLLVEHFHGLSYGTR